MQYKKSLQHILGCLKALFWLSKHFFPNLKKKNFGKGCLPTDSACSSMRNFWQKDSGLILSHCSPPLKACWILIPDIFTVQVLKQVTMGINIIILICNSERLRDSPQYKQQTMELKQELSSADCSSVLFRLSCVTKTWSLNCSFII